MDIAFEQKGWNAFRSDGQDSRDSRPEWHGLCIRMAAAHAARSQLPVELAQTGSFDLGSAQALSTYGAGLEDVNPTALGYGKADECIRGAVAASLNGDGRG